MKKTTKLFNLLKNDSKPHVFLAGEMDCRLLLSFGEYLFKSETPSLFIARAKPSIIFGINQNPYLECNIQQIQKDGIDLIRRTTGGGAVYVDPGTLMVGFFGPKKYPNFDKNNIDNIIIKSLNSFIKYPAEVVGKNDIKVAIDGVYNKIAGQAYKISDTHYKHHLSILVDTEMNKLSKYLTPNKLKMQSKATKSAKSNVINMVDIINSTNSTNCVELCYNLTGKLVENFLDHYNFQNYNQSVIIGQRAYTNLLLLLNKYKNNNTNVITTNNLLQIPEIAGTYKTLCSNEMVFGRTPDFTHEFEARYDWGTVRVELFVKGNVIRQITCYTDSIITNIPEKLKTILIGKPYIKQIIAYEFNIAHDNCDNDDMRNILNNIKFLILDNIL
jgi:lipoate---protein ligase